MQRSADSPNDVLSIFPEELSGVQKTYNFDLSEQSYAFSEICFHIYPGWYPQHISKIIRTFAPGAPLLPCGDAPLFFLSPEGLFYKKSLSPQKIRGQQGDKREKVKKLKYLFTISYILSLFPASGNEKWKGLKRLEKRWNVVFYRKCPIDRCRGPFNWKNLFIPFQYV